MSDNARDDDIAEARIEPLLVDANRLRARGDFEAAEQRCREALAAAPGNWEAHELLGDILYQQRRGTDAIEHYRLARAGNPQRPVLEDKIGRASLLLAEKEILRLRAEDLLAGRRDDVPRRPGVAALLSLIVPGFGQIYNREHLKGAIVVAIWLMLVLGVAGAALGSLHGTVGGGRLGLGQFDLAAVFTVFFSRPALWWTLLSIGLWLYAIADGAIQAAKTMMAPEDLA
ncbi:MAG: tetratricopeptide repeat protein [Armatimonadota bacterium]|nr:MAG: tetratricopeptide repeat protein [Armatimonadota bacterium]